MSQQPYDSDDCERGHIGIRSAAMLETVPIIGTAYHHPGIVPAEIGELE